MTILSYVHLLERIMVVSGDTTVIMSCYWISASGFHLCPAKCHFVFPFSDTTKISLLELLMSCSEWFSLSLQSCASACPIFLACSVVESVHQDTSATLETKESIHLFIWTVVGNPCIPHMVYYYFFAVSKYAHEKGLVPVQTLVWIVPEPQNESISLSIPCKHGPTFLPIFVHHCDSTQKTAPEPLLTYLYFCTYPYLLLHKTHLTLRCT